MQVLSRAVTKADRRKRLAIALMCGGALIATGQSASAQSAAAQSAAAPPAPATDQTAPTVSLEDIVVTAQRREQNLSKVPVSVTALSEMTLKTQTITDTQSLVQISPSVSFTGGFSANTSGFIIRGISSTSGQGGVQQSTAMVIDGVPLARPGEFLGELGDIERVEILPGPQGTLFGKNATAGVLNIVSKRPTDRFEGYVEGDYTTDKEASVRGMINAPLSATARLRVNAYYDHLDPLFKNMDPNGPNPYGYARYGVAGKLDIDLAPGLTLKLSADYRHAVSGLGQAFNVVSSDTPYMSSAGTTLGALQNAVQGFTPTYGHPQFNFDASTTDRSEGYAFIGELGWVVGGGLKITSITGYRHFKDDNTSDVDDLPVGFDRGVGFTANPLHYPVMTVDQGLPRQPQQVGYLSEELRANYSSGGLNLVGGGFFQTLRDNGAGVTPFIFDGGYILGVPALTGTYFYSATPLTYHVKDDTIAAFVDGTINLIDKVSVFGGLRYTHEKVSEDYDNNTYFTAVATNFGATILPTLNVSTGQLTSAATPVGSIAFDDSRTVDNLSGRFGVQYQPTNDLNLYASYNRGYKGPAADVSGGAQQPSGSYSPLLKEETAESYEIGAKAKLFDNRLQLNLDVFFETVNNLQQSTVLSNAETELITAGKVKSDGVEFDGRFRATHELTLNGSLVYDDPRYAGGELYVGCYPGQTAAEGCVAHGAGTAQLMDGHQTVNSYKWRYNLGATYVRPVGASGMDLTLHTDWQYFSSSPQRVDTDPLLTVPGHGMLNASIILANKDKNWSVQLFGKNLTNKFYYAGLVNVDSVIARVSGYVNRDFHAYGGIKVQIGF